MSIIHSIILSIVEGLTEFVPVSSTAHILLAAKALRIPSSPFLETFTVAIQSGAILAAVWFFWKTIWKNLSLIPKVIVAFIPTGIAGVFLYPLIKPLFDRPIVMAIALIAAGAWLLVLKTNDEDAPVVDITYKQAFLLGLVQIASFIPGVSRAGATLIGGSLMKIPRNVIVPFSFILAIPTILGASVVELRHATALSGSEYGLIALGVAVSFIVASITLKFFINLLTKKPLAYFGRYRIAIGAIALFFLK